MAALTLQRGKDGQAAQSEPCSSGSLRPDISSVKCSTRTRFEFFGHSKWNTYKAPSNAGPQVRTSSRGQRHNCPVRAPEVQFAQEPGFVIECDPESSGGPARLRRRPLPPPSPTQHPPGSQQLEGFGGLRPAPASG